MSAGTHKFRGSMVAMNGNHSWNHPDFNSIGTAKPSHHAYQSGTHQQRDMPQMCVHHMERHIAEGRAVEQPIIRWSWILDWAYLNKNKDINEVMKDT